MSICAESKELLPPPGLKTAPEFARLLREIHEPTRFHRAELHALDGYLSISVGGCATGCAFVIVAYSPQAMDHRRSETQAFAANEDGSFFGGFSDRGRWFGGNRVEAQEDWQWVAETNYESSAFAESRVYGAWNPPLCLSRLLGRKRPAKPAPHAVPHDGSGDDDGDELYPHLISPHF